MNKLAEDFLRTFTPPQIAMISTLAIEMEVYGLTAIEVIALCEQYMFDLKSKMDAAPKESTNPAKPKRIRHQALPEFSVKCPVCGASLHISPVNVSKCTAVGGKWQTSLMCSNVSCRFTELSEKSTSDWGLL